MIDIASEIVVVVDGYDNGYLTETEEYAHRNKGVTIKLVPLSQIKPCYS